MKKTTRESRVRFTIYLNFWIVKRIRRSKHDGLARHSREFNLDYANFRCIASFIYSTKLRQTRALILLLYLVGLIKTITKKVYEFYSVSFVLRSSVGARNRVVNVSLHAHSSPLHFDKYNMYLRFRTTHDHYSHRQGVFFSFSIDNDSSALL
jgi:hypothetical protein